MFFAYRPDNTSEKRRKIKCSAKDWFFTFLGISLSGKRLNGLKLNEIHALTELKNIYWNSVKESSDHFSLKHCSFCLNSVCSKSTYDSMCYSKYRSISPRIVRQYSHIAMPREWLYARTTALIGISSLFRIDRMYRAGC